MLEVIRRGSNDFFISMGEPNFIPVGLRFVGINGNTPQAAETVVQVECAFTFTFFQQACNIATNSIDAEQTWNIRDDAVAVGAPIVVPALTTGRFISAVIPTTILAGSLINYGKVDAGVLGTQNFRAHWGHCRR